MEIKKGEYHLLGLKLTDESANKGTQLQIVQNLKILLNGSKNLSNVSVESLLENSACFTSFKKYDQEFLFGYASSLINYLGRQANLFPKLILEIETVLMELKNLNETLTEFLIEKLWKQLKKFPHFFPKHDQNILMLSKKYLEKTVLNWVESTPAEWDTDFFVKMSVCSPALFQTITAILFQLMIKSGGAAKIAMLVESLIESVISVCQREEKDFLSLYPRECRHLVAFLMMPPEAFCSLDDTACRLLLEAFVEDQRQILMLLLHFPEWLQVLKIYFENINIIENKNLS